MRRFLWLVGVVAVGTGCSKARKPDDGPMPITFGDCAGPNTSWVSGPKPTPFVTEEAKDVETLGKVADKAPPPPDDKPDDGADESGGTGTAMTHTGKGANDPQLARQQAIEQARASGILGSTASAQGGAFASLTGTGDVSSGFDDTNIYGGLLGNEEDGVKPDGFGPGGGGTGWGTIGTGRYGTIGHRAGTGTGYGVGNGPGGMRGTISAVPTVSIGQPNAQGDLDKAIIRRYIKRNIQKIQYCYEKELLVKPALSGTVSMQFFISPSGEVATSSGAGMDPNVASCVADVIKSIVFPKPKGGGGVQVNYPFTFRPGEGAVAAKPDPTAGSAVEHADPSPRKVPPPMSPGGYKPGESNPLRTEQAALETCFRAGKTHFGVAVLDFRGPDADVHGIEDPQVKKCVLAITKKLKSTGMTGERCSVAFGQMPLAAAPSVEITASAVMFNGVKHGTIAELAAEDSLQLKVPSLFEAFETRMRGARAAVVTIGGPLVIKPIDAAKMKIVNRVVATTLMAGEDFVLAHQVGTDWQLMTPVAFPMVPVPFGTGDYFSFHRVPARELSGGAAPDESVRLSVLVQAGRIWVGLSRVNEFQEVPDPAKLGEVLAGYKQSAFFVDRTDVEIAGDDDATYLEVINAIKAAQAAGFTGWQLNHPNGLAARPQQ